ncbi:MAG: dephospho-CoA kinase [Clostridia bacterium]|nr:dephospho-CoA kinase [Clostridia bacterium]
MFLLKGCEHMILGLTGFSGAGKSTVAAILKENGFYHLDCDAMVHDEVYTDPTVLKALALKFGDQIITNGTLDRIALRHCVMGNPDALELLNLTVRPFILDYIDRHLKNHASENIILDAPLLFESGLESQCDKVLSVITDPQTALKRIIQRDSLSKTDAQKRLQSQHDSTYYTDRSDYVIKNDRDLDDLRAQTQAVLSKLNEIYN